MASINEISDTIIDRINEAVRSNKSLTRTELSREVCRWLGWKSRNGQLQDMSCRKILAQLHQTGKILLPESQTHVNFRTKPKYEIHEELPAIHNAINVDLDALGEIKLILVSGNTKESRIWNYFMKNFHYLKNPSLVGAQLRYLIFCENYGWLGGLSFSASSWKVEKRDLFIGWSQNAREKNLQLLINNSRFLILPKVDVPNLASYVLTMAKKKIQKDWIFSYSYAPVMMETYVERERFFGACYRAAGWIFVGKTQGRGRQDTNEPVKDIYLMPLDDDWKKTLCEQTDGSLSKPSYIESEPARDWAKHELAEVDIGDKRLNVRLVQILSDLYNNPLANLPEACGDKIKMKAVYRLLGNDKVCFDDILDSHYQATTERCIGEKIILAAQDTTFLDHTSHKKTTGLGHINTKPDKSKGLVVHDTMTFNEHGTPLGLIDVLCWARPEGSLVEQNPARSIEDKESHKWLRSYRAASLLQARNTDALVISMGDRESDLYELFAEYESTAKGAQLLIRSERSRYRKIIDNDTGEINALWEVIPEIISTEKITVKVPSRHDTPARNAEVTIRYKAVTLHPPKSTKYLPDIKAWAVYAKEDDPIDPDNYLEWMLLTTLPVNNYSDANKMVNYYSKRWGIEIYHKVMKSGCGVEKRQVNTAEKLKRILALDMIVAWRIYYLTKIGRETPEVPCTVFFEDCDWKALMCFTNKTQEPPKLPPNLTEATRLLAKLGGFIDRKSDGDPGHEVIWRGLERLHDISASWLIFSPYAQLEKPKT
jgi:hypothetical protein